MIVLQIFNDIREENVHSLIFPQVVQCKRQIVNMHCFAIQLVNNFIDDLLVWNVTTSSGLKVLTKSGCKRAQTWEMCFHDIWLYDLCNSRQNVILWFGRSSTSGKVHVILKISLMYIFEGCFIFIV